MPTLTEPGLLATWEAGRYQPPTERALTLAGAASGLSASALSALPLGRRDALLLQLRQGCFGDHLVCEIDCPNCGERLELELAVADLLVPEPATAIGQLQAAGRTIGYRAPTSADVLTAAADPGSARRRLVSACVLDLAADELTEDIVDAVASRLGETDPQADLQLALDCSCCEHGWSAPFDIGEFLWAELDGYARRLLYEVHLLACAYGWSEADVLAVGPVRRQFYLEVAPV